MKFLSCPTQSTGRGGHSFIARRINSKVLLTRKIIIWALAILVSSAMGVNLYGEIVSLFGACRSPYPELKSSMRDPAINLNKQTFRQSSTPGPAFTPTNAVVPN
jgi:hypothetical protein